MPDIHSAKQPTSLDEWRGLEHNLRRKIKHLEDKAIYHLERGEYLKGLNVTAEILPLEAKLELAEGEVNARTEQTKTDAGPDSQLQVQGA